jgi:hypothetical protein
VLIQDGLAEVVYRFEALLADRGEGRDGGECLGAPPGPPRAAWGFAAIPTKRAARLRGRSSMDFVSLVVHGLSAIAVYSDVVGVRLLVLALILGLAGLGGLIAAVIVRLATPWAIPGWATVAAGISLLLLVQAIMLSFVLSLVILGSRQGTTFLPRCGYSAFVDGSWTLHDPSRPADLEATPEWGANGPLECV